MKPERQQGKDKIQGAATVKADNKLAGGSESEVSKYLKSKTKIK
jgi:hypothetical protein